MSLELHIDGSAQPLDFGPGAKLSAIREQLGFGFDQYQFVYDNPVVGKMVLNHQSVEKKKKLEDGFIFDDNIVLMANVSSSHPDLFGNRTDFFRNRNMGVRVARNTVDGGSLGPEDFQPLMLEGVNPANPESDVYFDKMVICQKGSLVQFEISSWGAAGYGYSIKTERDPIVNSLYVTYGDSYDRTAWSTLRRYQDQPGPTIQIESLESKGYSENLKAEYSKVTVKTWRVTSYSRGGTTYTSDTPAPQPRLGSDDDGDGGLFGGDPAGDTFVPDGSVESALPTGGSPSSQTFGTIYGVEEDKPPHVLGAVAFYLFVFKDKAAVNEVLKVINSSDPEPFPV